MPSLPEFYPSRNNAATEGKRKESEGREVDPDGDQSRTNWTRPKSLQEGEWGGKREKADRREEDGCEAQGQENSSPPPAPSSPPLFIITRLHIIEGGRRFCYAAHVIPGPLNHSSIDKTNMKELANSEGVLSSPRPRVRGLPPFLFGRRRRKG